MPRCTDLCAAVITRRAWSRSLSGARPDWDAARTVARSLPVDAIANGWGTGLPGVWPYEPESARELLVELVNRVSMLWESDGRQAHRFAAGDQDVLDVESVSFGGWANDAQLDLESLYSFGLDAPAGFAEPDYPAVEKMLPAARAGWRE